MSTQKGVALVQVLIISVVLIMLSIFIGQTLKIQISTAKDIQQVHELRLELESVEALVFNALLSNISYENRSSDNPVVREWNFYGEEFEVEGVKVVLQDLGGLISLNTFNRMDMRKVLLSLGGEEQQVSIFIDSLRDWIDPDSDTKSMGAESSYYAQTTGVGPRNGFIQSIDEVFYIRGNEVLEPEQWTMFFTTATTPQFNPMNSPKELLSEFVLDKSMAERVLKLRREHSLTKSKFREITGIDEDGFIEFYSSGKFKLTLSNLKYGTQLKKTFIIDLNSRDVTNPLTITDIVWNKS